MYTYMYMLGLAGAWFPGTQMKGTQETRSMQLQEVYSSHGAMWLPPKTSEEQLRETETWGF